MSDFIGTTNSIVEELLKVIPSTFLMSEVFEKECHNSEFRGRWYFLRTKVSLRDGNMFASCEDKANILLENTLKFFTLKKHRVVYGGGGIMPDHFIPLDTTRYTKLHRELAAKNIIISHNLRFMDKNRKQILKKYPSFEMFKQQFEVPQSLVDEMLKEGEKQNIKPKDDDELTKTLPYLKLQLKALIARDLWDMSEYYSIFNEESEIFNKAVELLTSPQ